MRGRINVGAEFRERFKLAEATNASRKPPATFLCFIAGTCRVAANAGNGNAHVHRRTLAGEEQVGLQVNLPVGNRDHVRRNVGRDFAFECSTIGSAVNEPPPSSLLSFAARSSKRLWA